MEAYNPNKRPHLPNEVPLSDEVARAAAEREMIGFDAEVKGFFEGYHGKQIVPQASEQREPLAYDPSAQDELTRAAQDLALSGTPLPDLRQYDQSTIPSPDYRLNTAPKDVPPRKRSLRQRLGKVLPINTGRHTLPHTERIKRSFSRARNIFKVRD